MQSANQKASEAAATTPKARYVTPRKLTVLPSRKPAADASTFAAKRGPR